MKFFKSEGKNKKHRRVEICKVQEIWVEIEAMLSFKLAHSFKFMKHNKQQKELSDIYNQLKLKIL